MILSPSTTDQLMAMAAYRYCLGRRSYIVSTCQEWILAIWEQLTNNTRQVMVRDICEALMDGLAGMDCDEHGWRRVGSWAYARLTEEGQKWVKSAVAYKHKAWPLEDTDANLA